MPSLCYNNEQMTIMELTTTLELDSRVWILEHFSSLIIKYKKLKGEAYRMMNARRQQIMMRELRLMTHELGF